MKAMKPLSLPSLSRFKSLRPFSNQPMMFNRQMKEAQREKAATMSDSKEFDYLRSEVARRLAERLLDITRKFPVAVDLGCGTGHIRKHLGDRGGIENFVQLELSPSALKRDFSMPKADYPEAAPDTRTEWYGVADEEFLPLQPNSVDLVISSMSLHWVNDLPGCLKQIHKALKPDGVFLCAMLGGETLQELRSSLALADMERLGGVRPHVSPFVRLSDCGNLLSEAGFNLPTVDSDALSVPYPDMFTLVDHLKGMAESNANIDRTLPMSKDSLLAAASIYESMYADEDGIIPATFEVMYMIGWKPHVSQQKPDRRGSAKGSIRDLPAGADPSLPAP